MRALRHPLLLLCVAALVACDGQSAMDFVMKGPADDHATKRVTRILETVRDYGNTTHPKLQVAICLWHADVEHINDQGQVGVALDRFENWQRAGHIFPRLRQFSVEKTVKVDSAKVPTYLVSGKIDGRRFAVRVPSGGEMRWERAK